MREMRFWLANRITENIELIWVNHSMILHHHAVGVNLRSIATRGYLDLVESCTAKENLSLSIWNLPNFYLKNSLSTLFFTNVSSTRDRDFPSDKRMMYNSRVLSRQFLRNYTRSVWLVTLRGNQHHEVIHLLQRVESMGVCSKRTQENHSHRILQSRW